LPAKIKKVVYCIPNKRDPEAKKETPATPKELVNYVKSDMHIYSQLDMTKPLGLEFIQIRDRIHDRFFFSIQDDTMIEGLSIGTSLNSLERNYYCIYKLPTSFAKDIFIQLSSLVTPVSIMSQASI
jgi:hypothetical protein